MTQTLEDARRAELDLRRRLSRLVTEWRRAQSEVERLRRLSARPHAVPEMEETRRRQQDRHGMLGREIDDVRLALRAQEAVVASLEADADGAPPAG